MTHTILNLKDQNALREFLEYWGWLLGDERIVILNLS